MKLLLILILLLCILMMGAALSECVKKPQKQLEKGVWLGMFPLFLLVMIFTTSNLILPNEQPLIMGLQNISILFYLFSCLLFGLATRFNKASTSKWSIQ